jgi:aminoglycoside phosphotransferase (APT) family kinase protein
MSASGGERRSARLGEIVGRALGEEVEVEDLTRLPGGASKETWTFLATGPRGLHRRLVLRADRAASAATPMAIESALLRAAADAGVPVPTVVASGADSEIGPGGFLVTDFVEGETIPRRILRDEQWAPARAVLTRQCGEILAAIHRIRPDSVHGLGMLENPVAQLRRQLDQLGQPHPAFELGLLWLDRNRPRDGPTGVVHGDFRNGNLIVGETGIRAVLDWELAHLGDPIEDLGWLCVRAWRFGSPLVVGGFGGIEDLLDAYHEAGGATVGPSELWWWIAFGTLRWGAICIAQALTHLSGVVRSVELAAIGRRVCEVESDLLELLPWGDPGAGEDRPSPTGELPASPPHDLPTAIELLDAVRDYLDHDVLAATEGRVRFHGRVASNVVAMVAREIGSANQMARAHAERLRALRVENDADLADRIRRGTFDDRLDDVANSVRAAVADKLAVANPDYRSDRPLADR